MIKRILSLCLTALILATGLTSCAEDPAEKEPTEQTQPGGNDQNTGNKQENNDQENNDQGNNEQGQGDGEGQIHPENDPIADDLPLWN